MIQTVDFFPPVADDPYTFGQIAAANALSDIYAMGGVPKLALNIVGFPDCLDASVLQEIMNGGADKVKEAGAVLSGGHSVRNDEPLYGLCVSGFVDPRKIWKNFGARAGDSLILTKQIGSGILNTAVKGGLASEGSVRELITVMSSLNRKARDVMTDYDVHACTDITGFGLIGHCLEMAQAGNVTLEIKVKNVPFIAGAPEYAQEGFVPAGTYSNKEYQQKNVDGSGADEKYSDLLYDPQTSGGLLLSVSDSDVPDIMHAFRRAQMDTQVAVIGRVLPAGEKLIKLR